MGKATLLLALVAGCEPGVAPPSPIADPVLLTALFLDARAIEALASDFACAGIETAGTEDDPAPEVLAALRARLGTMVPQSRCRRDTRTSLVVAEGLIGTGTWLTIGEIECAAPDRCRATVSYYVANQGAGGREVAASRAEGGWTITPAGNAWVS